MCLKIAYGLRLRDESETRGLQELALTITGNLNLFMSPFSSRISIHQLSFKKLSFFCVFLFDFLVHDHSQLILLIVCRNIVPMLYLNSLERKLARWNLSHVLIEKSQLLSEIAEKHEGMGYRKERTRTGGRGVRNVLWKKQKDKEGGGEWHVIKCIKTKSKQPTRV